MAKSSRPSANLVAALSGLFLLAAGSFATAGVFGDGEPANGPEDDRRGISEGADGDAVHDWFRSAGTIHCDGAIRGSATLVDLRDFGPGPGGRIILTAAHLFYDLDTGRPWEACRFHYLGLGALPGYQVNIDRHQVLAGEFDPAADVSSPVEGAGDWAFAWLGPDWQPPGDAQGLPLAPARAVADTGGILGLVAWDRHRKQVSVAAGCTAVFSAPGDLGGGAWPGQLLDDCDSDDGASGGALVSRWGARDRIIAVRGGAHWDQETWPPARYPQGPPAGYAWDTRVHTNFARAIDEALLGRLADWLAGLVSAPATGQGMVQEDTNFSERSR